MMTSILKDSVKVHQTSEIEHLLIKSHILKILESWIYNSKEKTPSSPEEVKV